MIEFENIGLRYGIGPEVLRDVNFLLEPGSFHFLCGASGAGKTSLLRLLYLGILPTRGRLRLFNQDTGNLNRHEMCALRQKIGVVFQDFRLLPHLSVFDNVALPLRILGESEATIAENVKTLIDWVGLGDYMKRKPHTLSGGQQQRIAIARAVVTKPKLLLADEPTGNLDDEIGFRLLNMFQHLNRTGTTIVIATHNVKLLEHFNYPKLQLCGGELRVERPHVAPLQRTLDGVY